MLPMSLSTFVPTTAACACADTVVGDVLAEPFTLPLLLFPAVVIVFEQLDAIEDGVWGSVCGGESCWMQPARVVVIEPVDEEDDVDEDEWDSMCCMGW